MTIDNIHIAFLAPIYLDIFVAGRLSSLTDFEASHNNLRELPKTMQNLRNLSRLDLRHNNISELPYLALAT